MDNGDVTYEVGASGGSKAFSKENIGMIHELLIVGWKLTPYGEAWQVYPIVDYGRSSVESIAIGFGQFDIDTLCLAPNSNLDHLSWQPGPYFDMDFTDAPKWRDWKEMDLPCSEKELQSLAKCCKNGFVHSANNKDTFVIRNKMKHAHSATYCVKNIRLDIPTSEWIATVLSVTTID